MVTRGMALAGMVTGALFAQLPQAAQADLTQVRAATENLSDAAFGVRDDQGVALDGLEVLQIGPRRYVGVHHTVVGDHYETRLVNSTDLTRWHPERTLAKDGSQPSIADVPGGGYVVADERGTTLGLLPPIVLPESVTGPTRLWLLQKSQLRFRYYPTVSALMAGRAERTYVAPRRLSRTNEGTPSITVTRDGPGVAGLRVTTGLHYFADLDGDGLPDADRQATGVMRGFRTWTATARPDIDAQSFAATGFHAPYAASVTGSIGDRDEVTLPDGTTAIVADAQYVRADFGAWRLFLRDPAGGPATPLNPITPGGSLLSIGNPSLTALTLPDERPALVFTGFVYGGAPGEGGTVVHVQPLG